MQDRDYQMRYYFRRKDPLRLDTSEETELAYQLHNSTPNDPDVLERMVHLYAGDLYKWVGILLYYRKMTEISQEEILSVLKKVFAKAIAHVEQFHGQGRVSTWLFAISYEMVKPRRLRDWVNNLGQGGNPHYENIGISEQQTPSDWAHLDESPEKIRSVLLLRYIFDLQIPDIANILNIPVKDVHRRLVIGRSRLIVNPNVSHLEPLIQAYVDGLLDEHPDELDQLMQHLDTCKLCQASISKINSFEKTLAESIKERWLVSVLGKEYIEGLVQSILSEIKQPRVWRKVKLPIRQVVWTLGLSMMFVGLAILFIRITPSEREFPLLDATTTPELPPITNLPPAIAASQIAWESTAAPQYIDPAFSSDGKWAVFASIKTDPTTQAIILPTIEIFNRESNSIQSISESKATLNLPWIWWDLAPSISGDGRWITYVSAANDPNITGDACISPDHHTCLDIFLYDREIGSTKRLTQAVNGGAADGDSLAPTISEDGKWAAFWSAADNLVTGVNNTCQLGETSITCLYIYLYNLETGKIEWIPVRNIPGDVIFGVDRISLSADGRYIGFTVTASTQAGITSPGNLSIINTQGSLTDTTNINASIPNIMQSSEAIVFDRITGDYEMENQAQDGTPGNGASSSPILSADGRYVAFASASTNLVHGDINKYSDVYLRDRVSGSIELISVRSDGKQGNDNSGLTFWGRGYYSINISSDGRYVIFESAATNLGQGLNTECSRLQANVCNLLYVHDRQTGNTEWITALPNQDFSFFSEISADGRWITFMQSFYNCSPVQFFCSNVMVYDRERGWMTNLTKFDVESPTLPWSYSGSLVLPWESWESTALAFSPDNKLIALGGNDSKVRIWNIPDGGFSINKKIPDVILTSEGKDYFTALAFTPGREWLAASTTSGVVYVWELSNGTLLYTLKDQIDPIRKLVFSQDGAHLVISTLNEAWIWSIGEGGLIKESSFSYGIAAVHAIDIAPKGNMLATARGDGSVWLQNLPSGKIIGRLGAEQVAVSSMAFSEDGTLLATRASDGVMYLWQIAANASDAPSVTLINAYQSSGYIGDLAFSPDNKYLASTGKVGEVTLWSVPDGKLFTISTSVPNGMVYSVAFSKDSSKLAAVFENEIVLWRIPTDRSSLFYVHSAIDTYSDSVPIPVATANDIPQLQSVDNVASVNLNLDQTTAVLPFPLIIPIHLPENMSFQEAIVYNDGSVWLRYDAYNQHVFQASLYIYEKIIGYSAPPTMTIGANADVIFTQVDASSGRASGEYVRGDWLWTQSIIPPTHDSLIGEVHDVWQWDNSSNSQRLRWQQNGLMIALYYQVYKPYKPVLSGSGHTYELLYVNSYLGQGDLVQIASGMILYSHMKIEITCNPPGHTEINPSKNSEVIGVGQSCSAPLQETHHRITNGSVVIK